MSFQSSLRKKIIFISSGVLLLVIVLFFLFTASKKTTHITQFGPIPTPIPILFTAKTYTDTTKNFSLQYPQEWNIEEKSSNDDQVASFIFQENGKDYTFQVIPGGTAGIQAYNTNVDRIENKSMYIGIRQFMKSTWFYQGKPFFVIVTPNEKDLNFSVFQMYLPPTNTEKYLGLFDQIVSRVHLPPELQNPSTPIVTLQDPGEIKVNKPQ